MRKSTEALIRTASGLFVPPSSQTIDLDPTLTTFDRARIEKAKAKRARKATRYGK